MVPALGGTSESYQDLYRGRSLCAGRPVIGERRKYRRGARSVHDRDLHGLYEDRLCPATFAELLQLPLTSFDNNYNLVGLGAESWSQSADGMTWTFKLRPGLVWSDDVPLTAEDYVFALKRAATEGYDFSWYWDFAGGIKNWKAVTEGKADVATLGLRAVDAHTRREHERRLGGFLRERYAGRKIHLLFAMDPLALEFLMRFRDEMFPGVPVVFTNVQRPTLATLDLPPDFIGVADNLDARRIVDLALRLRPEAREMVVVAGTAERDRVWATRMRTAVAELAPETPLRVLSDRSMGKSSGRSRN